MCFSAGASFVTGVALLFESAVFSHEAFWCGFLSVWCAFSALLTAWLCSLLSALP